MRIDKYISQKNPSLSRTKIKSLIENGYVKISGKTVEKPSYEIDEGTDFSQVAITGTPDELAYVGRGGLKLEAALEFFKIDVIGMKACDIGASTGGFTDCLLKRGAERVYAVDSGHGQLHESLKNNSRVVSLEGFNARNLTSKETDGLCDIAVSDVSFISQTHIIPNASSILCDSGIYIGLIKPQFEAGRKYIGKNGIVKDSEAYIISASNVINCAQSNGFICFGLIKSPIFGGDGNTEFLMICRKQSKDKVTDSEKFTIEMIKEAIQK